VQKKTRTQSKKKECGKRGWKRARGGGVKTENVGRLWWRMGGKKRGDAQTKKKKDEGKKKGKKGQRTGPRTNGLVS